jgi:hypothetical protein
METIKEIRLDISKVTHIKILKKETNNKDLEVIVEIFVGEKNIVKIPFEDDNSAVRFCDVNFPNVNLKI